MSISDFPAGWSTSKDDSEDDATASFQKQLAGCLGAPSDLLYGAAVRQESPDFDSPDGNTSLSETLSIDRTERAEQVFDVLHQSNMTDCMADSMGDYINRAFAESDDSDLQSAEVGDVEVGQLSAGHYGDDTVAMRATIPVEVSGLSISVYFDVLYVRSANTVVSVVFQSQDTPVDPQMTSKFTRLAVRKVAQQSPPAG